jgi:hypothetical protein
MCLSIARCSASTGPPGFLGILTVAVGKSPYRHTRLVAYRLLNRMAMKIAPALWLLLLAACGDADPAGPDGGDDDPPESGTPILERESLGTHACQVLDEPAEVAGNTLGSAMTVVDGTALAARASYGQVGDDEFAFILGVTPATFSPMGLGDETYRTTTLGSLRFPALAAAGDGATLAWVEGDEQQRVMLARLDAAGEVVGSAASIADTDNYAVALSVATSGSATHVIWVDSALHVQAFGADGAALGDAAVVRDAPISGAALAAAGDGTVVVWSELEEDAGVYLALLDGTGAVSAGPLRVSGALPEFTWADSPSVVAAGDELLVAWSERFWNDDPDGNLGTFDPVGHSIIRVARVDGDAGRVLAFERLQAVEDEIIHIQPALTAHGDAVALSWSRGTFIPACGGCITDNVRRLVLLEPRDLVPLGEVIEMVGVSGFSTATMMPAGGDLVHLLGLDYHAISTMALARTTCAPAS